MSRRRRQSEREHLVKTTREHNERFPSYSNDPAVVLQRQPNVIPVFSDSTCATKDQGSVCLTPSTGSTP